MLFWALKFVGVLRQSCAFFSGNPVSANSNSDNQDINTQHLQDESLFLFEAINIFVRNGHLFTQFKLRNSCSTCYSHSKYKNKDYIQFLNNQNKRD